MDAHEATPLPRRPAKPGTQGHLAREAQEDSALTREQLVQALSDLRLHQTELEVQNEELQRIRLQLDAERASYVELYDNAPIAYLSLSRSGIILKANLTLANMLNADRGAMINEHINRFILKDDQDDYYRHLRLLDEGRLNKSCNLRMVSQEGRSFCAHIETTIVPCAADVTQYRVTLTDVSDYMALHQILQEKNLQLDKALKTANKANRVKSEFLSRMSHELRSPLNAILGFSQLMASETTSLPTADQKFRIDQIQKAGWYLLGLITEILDLSLIESGNMNVQKESICLSDILSDCIGMIAPTAMLNHISLSTEPLDRHCFVLGDKVRLTQAILNLLSNGVKYNRPGGTLRLSFAIVAEGCLRIEVRDSGVGLSADKLAQLFQPFNRLGREHGDIEGTGIGLAVSKHLIETMGGTIGAESEVGVGSMFWIEIKLATRPMMLPVAQPPTPPKTTQQHSGKQRTVLYLEDDQANMELVRQLLARRPDLLLLGMPDAAQGITAALSHPPDVILMDISLPDMSGLAALQILRLDPRTQHIPVVAISANAMPGDIKDGLEAGFLHYLAKPIKVDELMHSLDFALHLAQIQTIG